MKNFTILTLVCTVWSSLLFAQLKSPQEVFGFRPGADYKLAKYDQMLTFYEQLAENSDRVQMKEIGTSVLGKPMIVLFISSSENISKLEEYRKTSEKLAKAKVSKSEAMNLAKTGKAVVWLDGGLHATEVAGAQMTPELAYKIATDESDEVKNIRDNVIMILMPVMNPDGLDIVANWYYRNLETPYETSRPPWLYHHYIGHDNNRDWFMNNMPESYHVNDIIYREWFPQIVYNHHQTSPAWARIFIPPFSNPVNPRIHPGATTGTNLIGTVMANRFAMKEMPGVVSYQTYSMWWNGGMRTVPYFHNMVGILSETAHATPTPRYYDPAKKPNTIGGRRGGMASNGTQIFYSYPWEGGESHFRDAVDYMLTGSMAVLDYAADRRQEYLYNIYKMGRDAIEGKLLGDNFQYIIPRNQSNRTESAKLVNLLMHGGIEVGIATRNFEVGETSFTKGDYVISTNQSFRPYIEDLLETQDYPDQYLYPGGPPTPPYDLAGWTLPMQMGLDVIKTESLQEISVDILNDFVRVGAEKEKGRGEAFMMSTTDNGSFQMANELLSKGIDVYRTTKSGDGYREGDFIVKADDVDAVEAFVSGALLQPLKRFPEGNTKQIFRSKVGLYKSWVSNMDEGWTRWVLTQYHVDWDTLHDADIRTGDLTQYDVIILPDQSPGSMVNGHSEGSMPAEYIGGMGLDGVMKLKEYAAQGGKLVTFDGSGDLLIDYFDIPVRNVTRGLSPQQFFIPGSLLRTNINPHKYSLGMPSEVAVSFSRSSGYSMQNPNYTGEGGEEREVERYPSPSADIIVNYSEKDILMSGWAMGEDRVLKNRPAMLVYPFDDGELIMFGFRPQFRGQSRATYKLIFNILYEND